MRIWAAQVGLSGLFKKKKKKRTKKHIKLERHALRGRSWEGCDYGQNTEYENYQIIIKYYLK